MIVLWRLSVKSQSDHKKKATVKLLSDFLTALLADSSPMFSYTLYVKGPAKIISTYLLLQGPYLMLIRKTRD